jgi:hypothetical protein
MPKWLEAKPVEQWSDAGQEEAHRLERKRLSENHYNRAHALAAWLLATLVAVNGGALATKFVERQHSAWFVAGVVLAILSGFASWQEAQDRTGLHYIESLPRANITPYGAKRAATWRWRWRALNLSAKVLNCLSLATFIAGCLFVAWHSPRP